MKYFLSLLGLVLLLIPRVVIALPFPYEILNTVTKLETQIKEIQLEEEKLIKLQEEKERLLNTEVPYNFLCSCVLTARYLGVAIPKGNNAWDLEPNSDTPIVGQLVLMSYEKTGHVAVLAEIREDGYLIIEGNFHSCQWNKRIIPKDYYAIKGFWIEISK